MTVRGQVPRQWLSASAWRLHVTLVAGVALCATATWLEWTRARAGHAVAWVYCFEWPLFGVLGVYVWWKLLREQVAGPAPEADRAHPQPQVDDPELRAWNAYLERLHAADPPGRPPRK